MIHHKQNEAWQYWNIIGKKFLLVNQPRIQQQIQIITWIQNKHVKLTHDQNSSMGGKSHAKHMCFLIINISFVKNDWIAKIYILYLYTTYRQFLNISLEE